MNDGGLTKCNQELSENTLPEFRAFNNWASACTVQKNTTVVYMGKYFRDTVLLR